ncbi:hypothetical protein Hanom_Chr05g00396871 [Helianthus anomalus]
MLLLYSLRKGLSWRLESRGYLVFLHKVKRTKLPFKLAKKTEIPLNSQRKMDGVNEPDVNGKISNLFGFKYGKTNLWTKVAKLAKPQGRKWHFTQKLLLYT